MSTKKRELSGSNRSMNLNEALAARVKDPLWFLARQWQTVELEAENGGALAYITLESRHFPVARLTRGKRQLEMDRHVPLEAFVEAEDKNRVADAWHTEALEYGFGLDTMSHRFQARAYNCFAIDDEPQSYVPM